MFLNILALGIVCLTIYFIIMFEREKREDEIFNYRIKQLFNKPYKDGINVVSNVNNFNTQSFYVNRVIDGDTIVVNGGHRIRFANIDAYESNSPMHLHIMNYMVPLLQGQNVNIDIRGKDKYGRLIGNVFTSNGLNVNHELVKNGMAVVYDNYCDRSSDEYRALKESERIAQVYRLGGWGMLLNRPEFDRHNY